MGLGGLGVRELDQFGAMKPRAHTYLDSLRGGSGDGGGRGGFDAEFGCIRLMEFWFGCIWEMVERGGGFKQNSIIMVKRVKAVIF